MSSTKLSPSGYGIVTSPDAQPIEFDYRQCVHCGMQFPRAEHAKLAARKALTPLEAMFYEQQGKTVRGFCLNCNGPICSAKCMECVPAERALEILEGTATHTQVSVSLGGIILPAGM